MPLSEKEEIELLELLEQEDRERVSPKIEQARNTDAMIIIARGGRGAGAKTMGLCSLLVQESHYQCHRVACLREIQNSLEESVYQVIQETVDRLRYPGWKFTREYAESPSGSRWIFRGLKDMRSTTSIKGLQGFTRFFVEEAATISSESWDILLPTLFRNKGSKLFAAYNPETETDPVTTKLWGPYTGSPDALLIECKPEGADNPWWGEALQKLSDRMRETDPDLWDHVYGGQPRKQGDNSVMSRPAVRQAMQRRLPSQDGLKEQIGIDVARFGDDKTTIWHRRGMKIIQWKELAGKDTQEVARTAWEMGRRDTAVLFAVDDSGVGCITGQTKVLTTNGWMKAADLAVGDCVYSKDGNGKVCTETLRRITPSESVILTQDKMEFSYSHVIPYKTRPKYPYKQTSWENILKKDYSYFDNEFLYSAETKDIDLVGHEIIMPHGGVKKIWEKQTIEAKKMAAFLGWFLSEGSIYDNEIGITQTKPGHDIREVMEVFGAKVYQNEDTWKMNYRPLVNWILSECCVDGKTGFYNWKIPRWLANNSPDVIEVFLDYFRRGDGYMHNGVRYFVTSSLPLVDGLGECLSKTGKYFGYYKKSESGSKSKIFGREITRTVDCWCVFEFAGKQNSVCTKRDEGFTESTGTVYELSITGETNLFYTMCPGARPIWTHNGGVSDKLKDLGANVQMVNFGGKPQDDRKYTSVADELWFDFPIDEVEIPDDDMLFEELTQRKYGYDQRDRRKVEPKDEFKKRIGRSPDRADGLLLAFYVRGSSSIMTDEQRAAMASRRR